MLVKLINGTCIDPSKVTYISRLYNTHLCNTSFNITYEEKDIIFIQNDYNKNIRELHEEITKLCTDIKENSEIEVAKDAVKLLGEVIKSIAKDRDFYKAEFESNKNKVWTDPDMLEMYKEGQFNSYKDGISAEKILEKFKTKNTSKDV